MNTARQIEDIEFIKIAEVRRITSFGTTKIYEMVNNGTFPSQIQLGGRSVVWVKSEVQQWAADQVEAARGGLRSVPTTSPSE